MIRQYDMGIGRQEKSLFKIYLMAPETFHLSEKTCRINDRTATNITVGIRIKNSRRDYMKAKFTGTDDNGMACIIAALRSDNMLRLFRKKIYDLPLPFISPLHAQNGDTAHGAHSKKWFFFECIIKNLIEGSIFMAGQDPCFFFNLSIFYIGAD